MNNHKKIDAYRWHKRKSWIRMNCAIIMAILLIVLLFMFPIVSDASETKLSDLYFFDDILNSDDASSFYSGEPYDICLANQDYKNIYYDKETAYTFEETLKNLLDKSVDISSLNNPYMSIIVKNSNELYVYFHESTISAYSNYSNLNVNISSDGTNCLQYIYNISNDSLLYMNTQGMSFSSNSRCIFLLSTSPINYRWNPTGVNGEINYMYEQNMCGAGEGGLNIGGRDNSASEHKRVYEGSCVYMQFSNLNSGNLHIVCKTDDYQKSNNYYVKLRVSNSTSVHRNALYTYKRSGSSGDFLNNFDVPNNTFNRGQYTEFDIPLTDFSNSGDYTIDLSTLNNGLVDSNDRTLQSFASNFENSSTGLQSAMESMVFSLLSVINYKFYDANASSYNVALDSFVYDVSVALCGGSGNDATEEIFDSFTLDMVSGALNQQDYPQTTEDDVKEQLNTTIIPNNYVPSPQNPSYPDAYNVTVPNTPSNNNDNSDTNNNNVAPTNNNNVTNGDYSPSVVNNNNVTIEQGNKYPDKGVMSSFIRIINNDKNNAVNDVNTLVAGNSFIQLCNNTLYAVPTQFWNAWLIALKAILGIIVSAFFLKILINWST